MKIHRATCLVPLIIAILAGCIGNDTTAPDAVDPARDPASPHFRPNVVVALLDSGINPYHAEFAEHYEVDDPAQYIPGYPGAEVLDLSPWTAGSFNRDDADEEVWSNTRAETLYRVAGSKIVGLISFLGDGGLPGGGHGTMTASRAAANTISVGGNATRLVVIQGTSLEAIRWAADQDWIDIISISSGISLGGVAPGAANAHNQAGIEAFQYAAHRKPMFASSGNGLGNVGVAGFPAWTRGPSGAPDVISVGANENGRMTVWHNFHPYIVGDGCANPRARDDSAEAVSDSGGGTSSATPFSAGTGAAILLEARYLLGDGHVGPRVADNAVDSFTGWDSLSPADGRIILAMGDPGLRDITTGPLADGVFTQQEFKDVLYHTALSEGSEDASDGEPCSTIYAGTVDGDDVPYEARVQYQGYGEVNADAADVAKQVLRGEVELPVRPEDDAWYERYHGFRTATYLG